LFLVEVFCASLLICGASIIAFTWLDLPRACRRRRRRRAACFFAFFAQLPAAFFALTFSTVSRLLAQLPAASLLPFGLLAVPPLLLGVRRRRRRRLQQAIDSYAFEVVGGSHPDHWVAPELTARARGRIPRQLRASFLHLGEVRMRLAADVDVTVGNLAAAVDTQQHCQPRRRASDGLLHLTAPDGI
tara:strand:- start:130 stop:690 length:561 start_codon:yes stop_codon:yes gene_type:complete